MLDVESTIFQKGNPYSERNRLCLVGIRVDSVNHIFMVEYDDSPYAESLVAIASLLHNVDCIVCFNAKFDLGWLARYGIVIPPHVRIFDCQLAEFILDSQRTPFPSLNSTLAKYSLGAKLDIVEREYWALGIDTPSIPLDILHPYLETDLEKTDALYQTLLLRMEQSQRALIGLHMSDLRVLLEMEYNGLLFDWVGMERASEEAGKELEAIDAQILTYVPSAFREQFNAGSGDHLSALLYGGTIEWRKGTAHQRTLKTGPRAGESVLGYRWEECTTVFPRLVTPPDGSGLKKDGFFSVDEETLKSIRHSGRPSRLLVGSLLERSRLEKLRGTYFRGIREHLEEYDWNRFIHGTFNQCRVITGRLSSEKPNQQNFPEILSQYIVSRFD